ncbi:juvenile hormone-binding protein-like [Leguminivora glycinivorella]|uniref:juvenile hormone-binding protein-like n=1 Tax=Leguminivora glycinivorella TaxID=1035111 RepID=UPI00200F3CA2|nr:juvenile hormone-binding protein-like [Leguminivora glycinivorella]
MNYKIYYIFTLALFNAVFPATSSSESLLISCYVGDIECMKKSTETFLKHTRGGIPAANILPNDPIHISAVDAPFEVDDLVYLNKNVTVSGMANQRLEDLQMNLGTGSVVLTTSGDVSIDGDMVQVFRIVGKSVAGRFRAYGRVLCTASYSYSFNRDGMGVEHYVVGPETNSCDLISSPVLSFISSCNAKFCPVDRKDLWKKNASKIVEQAYAVLIHNIRAAAKVLPATAFFKNPHGL